MSTFMPKADEIERKWYVIDAAGSRSAELQQKRHLFSEASTKPSSHPALTAAILL